MRMYYTSDLHGSNTCWLKFLASAKFYDAEMIVVGGDITGKFITPIMKQPNGEWVAELMGHQRRVRSEDELAKLEKSIAHTGAYPFRTTPEEAGYVSSDPDRIEELFKKLVIARLQEWMELAATRLKGTGVRVIVQPGNDDCFECDDVLAAAEIVENPDGTVLDLGYNMEMIGCGHANMTPWKCPRDVEEEELTRLIDESASQLKDPSRAVFNLHVPPYGSTLDNCPKLDEDFNLVMTPSGPEIGPAGSHAVRASIEKYQPFLGLHGHIHESKGQVQIGRTLCVNSGSEYGEGVLLGINIDIDTTSATVTKAALVSG